MIANHRDIDKTRGRHCPRLVGSTPAKVRKSIIRKVPELPFRVGRVGRQEGCAEKYDVGSALKSPRITSATMRPPTGPIRSPPLVVVGVGRGEGTRVGWVVWHARFPQDVVP